MMAGAVQTLLETGRVLRSLDLELGDPELEAAVYNLLLLMEQAGLPGIAIAWIAGIIVILIIRVLLLGLLGLVRRIMSARSPATVAAPHPRAAPHPAAAPGGGPWSRPPSPPSAVPATPPPPREGKRPSTVSTAPSVVDRADAGDLLAKRPGTVVLRRPRP